MEKETTVHPIVEQMASLISELHENRQIIEELKRTLGLNEKKALVPYVEKLREGATIGQIIDVEKTIRQIDEIWGTIDTGEIWSVREDLDNAYSKLDDIADQCDEVNNELSDVVLDLKNKVVGLQENQEEENAD
tara:strand:+ start:73 stop:474 length:402 start_codon:yes stop_codon:yes gene_type:complete